MNMIPLITVMGATATGTSVLTEGLKAAITQGMADLGATVSDVLVVSVPAVVGVIALTAGINFAMSKVRSVASWAS